LFERGRIPPLRVTGLGVKSKRNGRQAGGKAELNRGGQKRYSGTKGRAERPSAK